MPAVTRKLPFRDLRRRMYYVSTRSCLRALALMWYLPRDWCVGRALYYFMNVHQNSAVETWQLMIKHGIIVFDTQTMQTFPFRAFGKGTSDRRFVQRRYQITPEEPFHSGIVTLISYWIPRCPEMLADLQRAREITGLALVEIDESLVVTRV